MFVAGDSKVRFGCLGKIESPFKGLFAGLSEETDNDNDLIQFSWPSIVSA